ncbi:hypothetical protein [Hymenobacter cellulosivorans]|uniref:Uncharacterized protein n=1 Tax=Hymenobacter cellulosivorans TaxID=2932249 RepID=A0ABY4F7M5_9BACT|nr:hypothetical protein [Hymenobacter cellulosivorans]UOQ52023.1 hypothetical protein MUN80_19945 [Hymenobacter cellulosivorans]
MNPHFVHAFLNGMACLNTQNKKQLRPSEPAQTAPAGLTKTGPDNCHYRPGKELQAGLC